MDQITSRKVDHLTTYYYKGKEIAEEVEEYTDRRGRKHQAILWLNSKHMQGKSADRKTKADLLRDCTPQQAEIIKTYKGQNISEYMNI